jgi:hypothetical protein
MKYYKDFNGFRIIKQLNGKYACRHLGKDEGCVGMWLLPDFSLSTKSNQEFDSMDNAETAVENYWKGYIRNGNASTRR